jgi:tRNA 2-thiouridine synthesizing protein A
MPPVGRDNKAGGLSAYLLAVEGKNKGVIMKVQLLDTKGLSCPMPLLMAKKMITGLHPGDLLEILATDPGAVKDFQAFSRATGHRLVEWNEDNGVFRFVIKKSN